MNRQENVPPMMIRNAAGFIRIENGAPLRTIPTNTDIKLNIKPTIEACSKLNHPLFSNEYGRIHAVCYYITNDIIAQMSQNS